MRKYLVWQNALMDAIDGGNGLPKGLTPAGAFTVASKAGRHGKANGQHSWPAVATIGRAAGLSERQTRRYLSWLVAQGWLIVNQEGRGDETRCYSIATPARSGVI